MQAIFGKNNSDIFKPDISFFNLHLVFTSIYFKYINIIFIFWTGKQIIPVILNTDFTLKN